MIKIKLWITVMLGLVSGLAVETAAAELAIAMPGTQLAHFTYRDAPLLSFGGMSDFVFYFPGSTYDYRQWADWQAKHGMNHVRAYPPLSYRKMEAVLDENNVPRDEIIFPYLETEPGSRRFDLEKFNDAYWKELRKKLRYLNDKGVIVHLIIFNGWHITYEHSGNWDGHFFNPAVNVNPATEHLASNEHGFYHSVADGRSDLIALQKAWVRKIAEVSADFDNVYFDLVHELARNRHRGWLADRDEWDKVKPWVDVMAATLRETYKELSGRAAIVGMDGGPFTTQQRDWIFSRPYFDILIYGKRHEVHQSLQWREQYRKPFVPQESWDDSGAKWSYRFPEHRTHIRKYVWKMMMAKAQQIDIYVKPPRESDSLDDLDPPGLPHRYDPRGWNNFEEDATLLRLFWNQIEDYGSLRPQGDVTEGPGRHQLVLSSRDEAVVYLASRTGKEAVEFPASELRVSNLRLNDGAYTVSVFSPINGPIEAREVSIKGNKLSISLPAFIDDLIIHITPATAG
jgi:hypothetical protein